MVSFCVKNYEVKSLSREKLKYNFEQKKPGKGLLTAINKKSLVTEQMGRWMDGWIKIKL